MRPLRALVCSYSAPATDRDSGSRRMMDLIDFLCEAGWRVEFLATNAVDQPQASALRQRGIPVHTNDQLVEVVTSGGFDLVFAAFWPVAELLIPVIRRLSPTTRLLVDSVDLHFLRDARRSLGGSANGTLLSSDFGDQMIGELNCYAAADLVLTVSDKESGKLKDLLGTRTQVVCVPDCEELSPSPMSFSNRRGIVTVGSYTHSPNVQAVEFLCREILPLLPAEVMVEHPVYVVGNALDHRICKYGADLPNVRMVGWVPTVSEYFARSRISVVPLRYGAGTKRKMLEALMTGTPTVTTTIGAEGLNLNNEEQVLIADTPQEFAAAIERLLSDEELWTRLSRRGRQHILASHSRDVARGRFLEAVNQVLQTTPKPPQLADGGQKRYQQRVEYQYYHRIVDSVREMVCELSPENASVVVAGPGMKMLKHVDAHSILHLEESAEDSGQHLADRGRRLVARLEQLRLEGADYFVLPDSAAWWLEHFGDVRCYLEMRCNEVAKSSGNRLYLLSHDPIPSDAHPGAVISSISDHGAELFGTDGQSTNNADAARLIAFYLPQFHPIPENDKWWGEGFTEWTNVAKAQPLFPEHYQPHLPTDLGYYDLRLAETRAEQAALARSYGIHGFCYYHYWFHGKRLLQQPFDEILASGEPDFPFCLCWANEPWSRRWDGRPHDLLQPQNYSDEDDLAHIRWLIPALRDRRAIQIDGKPLLLIYQGRDLPNPARTVQTWRKEVEKAGLPGLYLMAVETGWDAGWDATDVGFDAKVLFQPQFSSLSTVPRYSVKSSRLRVFEYEHAWPVLANPEPVSYLRYDTVFPMWDNSARKGEDGWVVHNGTPAAYEEWLHLAIERTLDRPSDQRIVFINAWNEWAEGCHLEPDRQYGRAFLEATQRALIANRAFTKKTTLPSSRIMQLQ